MSELCLKRNCPSLAFFLIVVGILAPTRAWSEDFWLGKQVMPKETCRPVNNGRVVPFATLRLPSLVSKVDGDRLWIGEAWLQKSDVVLLSEASAYYTDYLARNPSSRWASANLAVVSLAEGKLEGALAIYTKLIEGASSEATDFNGRGFVYLKVGNFDAAIVDFNEAIRRDPGYVFAISNRAHAWAAKGDLKRALDDHTVALRIEPHRPEHFNNRGNVWKKLGEFDRAIDDYSHALRLKPTYLFALTNRGFAFESKGNIQLAVDDYMKAIEVDPKDSYSYRACAEIWATATDSKHRDGKRAIKFATKACELTSWQDGESLQVLAAAYAEAGRFVEAIKWQEQAIEVMRNDNQFMSRASVRLEQFKNGSAYHK